MAEPLTAAPRVEIPTSPQGIGGWLILIAIGQVLGPLRVLADLAQTYGSADMARAFKTIPLAMYGTLVIDLAYAIFMLATTVVFFTHKRFFKIMFTWEIFGIFLVVLLEFLWMSATINVPASKLIDASAGEIGQSIGATVAGLVWVAYVWRSKRVRNTFVN